MFLDYMIYDQLFIWIARGNREIQQILHGQNISGSTVQRSKIHARRIQSTNTPKYIY